MESGKRSVFVVAEKEMVLRCLLQQALEMRLHMPSKDQGSDEFFKYVLKREVTQHRLESIKSAGRNG